MSTLAQRNVAAFTGMKRSHSVSVGGTKLELQPPGILKIMDHRHRAGDIRVRKGRWT